MPVLVSEDHLSDYEAESDPFPQSFIDEVMTTWEKEIDDFTEFIPCFRLPKEEKFHAVVYWKVIKVEVFENDNNSSIFEE